MSDVLGGKTTQEWLDKLEGSGIPYSPINTLADVFADEQVKALEMVKEYQHPKLGEQPTIRNPVNFSETPTAIKKAPPLLNADEDFVLSEVLGYTQDQINRLESFDS